MRLGFKIDWTLLFAAISAVAAVSGFAYQVWTAWARSRLLKVRADIERSATRSGLFDLVISNGGEVPVYNVRVALTTSLPQDIFVEDTSTFSLPELREGRSYRKQVVRGTMEIGERLVHAPDGSVRLDVSYETRGLIRRRRRYTSLHDLTLLLDVASTPSADGLDGLRSELVQVRREIKEAADRVHRSNASALQEFFRFFRR